MSTSERCCAAGSSCLCGSKCSCAPGAPSCSGCAAAMCKCTAENRCAACKSFASRVEVAEILRRFTPERRASLAASIAVQDQEKRKQQLEWAGAAKQANADLPSLSVQELLALDGDVVVVDARTVEEAAVSMIPGAIHRTEFEFVAGSIPSDVQVVTHCLIGGRAASYARTLKEKNPDLNVAFMAGSALEWQALGLPFAKTSGEETFEFHPFAAKGRALVVDKYTVVGLE